jgi:hypothetical protein
MKVRIGKVNRIGNSLLVYLENTGVNGPSAFFFKPEEIPDLQKFLLKALHIINEHYPNLEAP